MKFRRGRGYLVHANFRDIAFEVLDVVAQGNKTAILQVFTWNRGWAGKPWLVPCSQPTRIIIKAENYNDWFYIDSLQRYYTP